MVYFNELLIFFVDLHWSEEYQMYCDASVDDDGK